MPTKEHEEMGAKLSKAPSAEKGTVQDVDASYLASQCAQPPDINIYMGGFVINTGYAPQMKRDFTWFQLFSCAFTVTNSWLGVTGGFSTGISIGGSATLIYGLIIVAVFNVAIVITLGELMSSMPNAGGQYYWAMKLAPRKLANASAYICGICNLLGGLTGMSSGAIASAYMILGCIKLVHPEFTIYAWHAVLIAIVFIMITSVLNLSESLVRKSVLIGLWWCVASCYIITIVPVSVAEEHASPSFIFASTENTSGWSSTGMAFLVGMINANYAFGLIDAGVHLAEEIPQPERNIPKALLAAVGIGFVTAWPVAVTLLDCITDFDAIATTDTGVPLLHLLYFALRRNRAGAIILQLLSVVSYFWCLMAYLKKHSVPINAHLLCIALSCVLCFLPLASTTAFNSLVTGVLVFPYISILIPATFSLLPMNKNIPKGSFSLGRWGTVARVVTVIFCLFATIIYAFPYTMLVDAGNINYFSAILGVVIIYAIIDWVVRARESFNQNIPR
ncbi:unnamed protein product [Clonostachys byssicola]|uniref:Amino acid transporter n=1 Tax=Clonostachys byssicola TaxID=160290 RepID=A0A9N9UNY4_9HYPO|nr:unnamed protein product [Clonostachys byssicola]